MLYKFKYSGWLYEPSSPCYPNNSHAALYVPSYGFVYMKVDRTVEFQNITYYKNRIYIYNNYLSEFNFNPPPGKFLSSYKTWV